jgi:hypothetical protein
MLKILVPMSEEYWDDQKEEFVDPDMFTLELEHSLASLSKWESKWEKPFLGKEDKTTEETLWYIRAMVLTPNVPEKVYENLTPGNVSQINAYIDAKMTATWFNESRGPQQRSTGEVLTAEIIYYLMFTYRIPLECENWHLNRLVTLIRVFNNKNAPSKKMNRRDAGQRQRELNAQRRSQLNTRG